MAQMNYYIDEVEQEQKFKPRLFTYPDPKSSIAVFEYEDLQEDEFVVVCVRKNPEGPEKASDDLIFVWEGESFQSQQLDEDSITREAFVRQVKEEYFGKECQKMEIKIFEEFQGEESELFQLYVQ